ncbi:MAG: hypothetical protein WDN26_01755 [Chitinophagaceae bacterium]
MFKMNYYFFILLIIGCNSSIDRHKEATSEYLSNSLDTSGFFSNCQELTGHLSSGYIQGINRSKDSLGSFYFSACYDCAQSFEVIFFHNKGENGTEIGWKEAKNGCSDYFKNFDCFAFIYTMRDPDKQKDIHAMNIDFPIKVRTYKRVINDNWKFIREIKAKTFEEFSLLQFKTIYNLN